MKKIVLIFIVLGSFVLNAQDTTVLNKLISKNLALNDSGKYGQAISGFDSIVPFLNKTQKANVFSSIGIANFRISKYDKAMEYFLSALNIYDDLGDEKGQSRTNAAIGVVYYSKGDIKSSLMSENKALLLAQKINDDDGLASIYNNLSLCYDVLNKIDSCIFYSTKTLKIGEKLNNQRIILTGYQSLAIYYSKIKQFDKAESFIKKSLSIVEKNGLPQVIANNLCILGQIYQEQGKYSQTKDCYERAYEIAKQVNEIYLLGTISVKLGDFYKKIGNFEKALYFSEETASYYDSIMNKESVKKIDELNAIYQFDRLNKEGKIKDLEVEKKSQAVNYLIVVASLILLTVVVIGFGYSRKKKANSLLEIKNKEIEHQKNEIVDSINYAKRIQTATLGSPDRVTELYDNSAVIFQPKDIVSGDFYWFNKIGNRFMFSVADCTGHGVPGAMMSMIGNNGLNDAVSKEKGINDPARILEHLSHQVHTNFNKNVTEIKDSMDISFCILNTDTKILEFAGAINPLLICKNNGEIIEIKGDKQFIGQKDSTYTNHSIQLETGDCVYIMSDGFADQFGGKDNKKFKIANFKKLLPTINSHEAQYQAGFLTSAINDWKGTTEQTDDICVMVVKI